MRMSSRCVAVMQRTVFVVSAVGVVVGGEGASFRVPPMLLNILSG